MLFPHVPLWTVYPEWGWGTDDSEQALGLLKRFGSVTVLNGHIHQIMQKVEGNISFHTAMSTAFPQPAPGTAPAPGPMKVEPDRLKSVLGITDVTFIPGRSSLAVVDATLSGLPPAFEAASHDAMMRRQAERKSVPLAPNEIGIDNFRFAPPTLTVTISGSNVVICWPVTCATWYLEQATSLSSPITWTRVLTPSVVSGGQNCVTLPYSGNAFFKLCAGPSCP